VNPRDNVDIEINRGDNFAQLHIMDPRENVFSAHRALIRWHEDSTAQLCFRVAQGVFLAVDG
jgi:hypothetical protein